MKRTNTVRSSSPVFLWFAVAVMLALSWGGGALADECLKGDTNCDTTRCSREDALGVIDQALDKGTLTCEGDVTCDDKVDLFDVLCTVDCSLGGRSCLTTPCTSGTLAAACADCRSLFFAREIVLADDCFEAALAMDPNDQEARFFHALTTPLRVVEDQTDGPNPAVYTDSFKEVLDQFGFPAEGRSIFDFYAQAPEPLPSDSPTGEDVQTFFLEVFLPAIREAIADVEAMDETFTTSLLAAELASFGWTDAETTEVDYGDVQVLRTFLQALRGFVAWWLTAYNLNIDIDALSSATNINGIQDILDMYPSLLDLTPQGATQLAEARDALREAIDAYYDASAFVRAETDPQTDDLFTIEPADEAEELETRLALGQVWCSLDGMNYLSLTNSGALCTAGTPLIDGEPVNLRRLFDPAFGLRSKLPLFNYDAQCDAEYVDCSNPTSTSPFPDPTLNGVFPGMTQQGACAAAGVIEFLCYESYFPPAIVGAGGGAWAGWLDLRNCDGLNGAPAVSDIRILGGGPFRIEYWDGQQWVDQVSLPQRLCPGDDGIVAQVFFEPTQTGTFTDTLRVTSDDPVTPTLDFAVKGCTQAPCEPVSCNSDDLIGTWYYCEFCDKTQLSPRSWFEVQNGGGLVFTLPTTENCTPQSGCTVNRSTGTWSLNGCTLSISVTQLDIQDSNACWLETGSLDVTIDSVTADTLVLGTPGGSPVIFKSTAGAVMCP